MKEDPPEEEEKPNSNAIGLSEPLRKILNNIEKNVEHDEAELLITG